MRLVKGMDDLSHCTPLQQIGVLQGNSAIHRYGSCGQASFRSDRLDLQQPFSIEGFSDHDRRRATPQAESAAQRQSRRSSTPFSFKMRSVTFRSVTAKRAA
jgi:hypothetical protein